MSKVMRALGCAFLAVVSVGAVSADEIKNWPAPPYWGGPARAYVPGDPSEEVGTQAAEGLPTSPVPFVAIVPCRIVDTRGNGFTGAYGPPALVGNAAARAFNVPAGPCAGIPGDAAAFSLNIGAILPGADGFLTAYPTGGTLPTVSNVNFLAGEVIANSAVIGAGTGGSISVFVNITTDVIIDINGYYAGSVVTSVTAGTGLTGGGTGAVTVGIAPGGVGTNELATGAVTSTKIGANAVTAGAIASNQVVKDINGLRDSVTLAGSGGITVTPGAGTITIGGGGGGSAPAGSFILGNPGDSTIIGAGYTEVGSSNVDLWSATATSGAPTGRFAHTAVWTGSRMIVWGGTPDNASFLNTGGQYDPVSDSWSATTTTGAPTARRYHTAVWTGSKMIVWGGADTVTIFNTGGQYDPVGNSWTATTTTGAPIARRLHTAAWTGSRMIVWGGNDDLTPYANTGGRYDPVANSWLATTTTNAPSGRESHTAVWTGSKMIVWGGFDGTYLSTGAQYDPTDSWTGTSNPGASAGRTTHTAVWTGSRMIVWGGFDGNLPYLNTGEQYDPVGNSWASLSTIGAPTGRHSHTAVWTGNRMIVWGGFVHLTGDANNGGQYDPANDAWAVAGTNTVGAPSARRQHTAVWTGAQMIVWGGGPTGNPVNTGGRYTILSLYLKN